MYKRLFLFAMIYLLSIAFMCSCSRNIEMTEKSTEDTEIASADSMFYPDISQIKELCELATLECYYHNVAKSVKEKGSGLLHIGEKERVFWIEYSGSVKFGIDMSKVEMEVSGTQITITIPRARLLSMSDYSFTEDNYISSDDGINKNPITAENQTDAVAKANEQIRQSFAENETLLIRAQERAKILIENYIEQLGSLSGIEYQISWIYEDNIPEEENNLSIPQTE